MSSNFDSITSCKIILFTKRIFYLSPYKSHLNVSRVNMFKWQSQPQLDCNKSGIFSSSYTQKKQCNNNLFVKCFIFPVYVSAVSGKTNVNKFMYFSIVNVKLFLNKGNCVM